MEALKAQRAADIERFRANEDELVRLQLANVQLAVDASAARELRTARAAARAELQHARTAVKTMQTKLRAERARVSERDHQVKILQAAIDKRREASANEEAAVREKLDSKQSVADRLMLKLEVEVQARFEAEQRVEDVEQMQKQLAALEAKNSEIEPMREKLEQQHASLHAQKELIASLQSRQRTEKKKSAVGRSIVTRLRAQSDASGLRSNKRPTVLSGEKEGKADYRLTAPIESLGEVLGNPNNTELFAQFLRNEFSEENLDFTLAVAGFRALDAGDAKVRFLRQPRLTGVFRH